MKDKDKLRRQAEEAARGGKAALSAELIEPLSTEEARRLLHELQVHQIELEMQNKELRRAQEELEASRARYFDLYDLAPVGYITLSDKGLIEEANLTAAKLLGVNRGALANQPISRFVLKEDQDVYYLHRKRLLETGEPQACELRMVKGGETAFWVRLEATAEPVHRVVISDITRRKRDEEENARLETQLRQAQKMESVGRLAGGVAHDFNNMLGVIIGHTELAMMPEDQPPVLLAHLKEIRKAACRSADLTRQLLAFARKQAIAPRVLDLNRTVMGMVEMLRRLIGEDIHLSFQPQAELWPVKVDPSQIDQILANLCVNARSAIAGVGKIAVETGNIAFGEDFCSDHPGFQPGEYVSLAVSDDGCGMDKETLGHVFEPFFTTREIGKGTGMGLATVYGVVKQNDGFIDVHSVPGRGTTFTVYLPRCKGETGPARMEGETGPLMRGRETILLVEDEPAVLKLTAKMLENLGYTVLAASTPGEAISMARERAGEIRLLLTDVVMPEMNGRELAGNLLSLDPRLKCLFMSGYTADIISQRGELDEGVRFIQKPFALRELAARVRETLDDGQGRGS
jgi:PAS domain S-box-containing protein